MPDLTDNRVTLFVDGRATHASAGSSVAAVLLSAPEACFRRSVRGEARGPLCGMGVCFECRVTIDGHAHRRSCQVVVKDGMQVTTDG